MTKVEKIHKLSGGAPISGLPEIGTSGTQVGYSRLAVRRLKGWSLARSRSWPSFETRAILRGARSSGVGGDACVAPTMLFQRAWISSYHRTIFDFLLRPCSAPVISAGFPGLRAVCRFLHPPAPIYRDLQGLLSALGKRRIPGSRSALSRFFARHCIRTLPNRDAVSSAEDTPAQSCGAHT
jgi:hypothetical protein